MGIPILIVTSIEDQQKGYALGADAYRIKPVDRQWLLTQLTQRTRPVAQPQVLIIDDEVASRYVLKNIFKNSRYVAMEAVNGEEGLRMAQVNLPQVIVLDLVMPDPSGVEVLASLKADAATRSIPVIIVSSQIIGEEVRARLLKQAVGFLPKEGLTRDALLDAVHQAIEGVGLTTGA
jgi:CheY-like chemotaxis protein